MITEVIVKRTSRRVKVYRDGKQYTHEVYENMRQVPDDVKAYVKRYGYRDVFGY